MIEKKKWPWKRKPSERNTGEGESSGSLSSHSERYSDEQDALRESPSGSTQSPEVMSKASNTDDETKESVKSLTAKLSAALVNVSAKEDLVKQHAKVAEQAVAGWEKAESEVAMLRQQLEVATQQNLNLEVRVSHLDGALKECVRELRQARDKQENKISDVAAEKDKEWESMKAELEKQILELQAQLETARTENCASIDPKSLLALETLEKENSFLKQELVSRCKVLEIMTIERDLSTRAAETASKLQLESIKKATKLEAECRRLQSVARKASPVSNPKSVAASNCYAESLTDSHSDSGDRLNAADTDTCMTSNVDTNGSEPGCSDSWASALIAELDQFRKDKPQPQILASCSFDMMDDFLEMERLAALPETKSNTPPFTVSESASGESISMDNPSKADLHSLIQRAAELEKKLQKIETEKLELVASLEESHGSLRAAQSRMAEAEAKLEELQKELHAANEAKESLEFQLVGMEAEARTMSANVDSLKAEVEKERILSAELTVRCQAMENELTRKVQETENQQIMNSDGELKVKQEDLAVAADKLAECQRTIASLGRQLKSLATLEDFLTDSANIPGLSGGPLVTGASGDASKLSSGDMSCDSDLTRTLRDEGRHLENGNRGESLQHSSFSTPSGNPAAAAKSRNGFGKFFSRSKSVMELNNRQE